jgi:hypothetical protein
MRRKQALRVVKELDAFPKVSEDYLKTTARGGVFSIISITAIAILLISEVMYYKDSEIIFQYSVDSAMIDLLKLRFDITVAMPCQHVGADVIDAAGNSRSLRQEIHKEPAVFELTGEQRAWLEAKQEIIKKYEGNRSLKDLMIEGREEGTFPRGNSAPPHDSCRIHGFVEVNKVAGNFHITAGQAIPHPQGHAHMSAFVPPSLLNFSHRIDNFGFGPATVGIVDPLEGTYVISDDRHHLYQYYIQVVPTVIRISHGVIHTNQYSVTERNRSISHSGGSHGLPGLFFKYEIYPMTVLIDEVYKPFLLFVVRLCSIVGGVFVTVGMMSQLLGYIYSCLIHRQPVPLEINN